MTSSLTIEQYLQPCVTIEPLEPIAIRSYDKLLLTVGASLGGMALIVGMSGGETAHADSTSGIDTPEHITVQKGETLWQDLADQGYKASEIIAELKRHGIKAEHLNMMPGTEWDVDPQTVAERQKRLKGGVELTLVQGGKTFWKQMKDMGIENNAGEVMDYNEKNEAWAEHGQAGIKLIVPAKYMPETQNQVKPTVTIILPAGSNITKELKKLHVDNPDKVALEVMELNKISREKSTKMMPGETFVVPADVIPESVTVEQPVPAVVNVPVPEAPPVPEVVPVPVAEQPPKPENVPAPEVVANPAEAAYSIIMQSIQSNNGVLTAEAANLSYDLISRIPNHPEKSYDFEVPEAFVKMPAPTVSMPYLVNPGTCSSELYGKPAEILSTMQDIALYEWLLTNPKYQSRRASVIEVGDLVSGDHKRHQFGNAGDIRSRLIMSPGSLDPHAIDGPVFNMYSENFDPEMTAEMLYLMLLARNPQGGWLYEHIEFANNDIIDDVNKALRSGGRDDNPLWFVEGHRDHIHRKSHIDKESDDGILGTPNTTKSCTYEYTQADDGLIQALMQKRGQYPVDKPVIVPNEVPVVAKGEWQLTAEVMAIIDESKLTDEEKEYFYRVTAAIMAEVEKGAPINAQAVIAMAMVEGGKGHGKGVIEGNNIFSVKASDKWVAEHPDKVVQIMDDEYDENGSRKFSNFKKYGSIEAAVEDFVNRLSKADHYQDAIACHSTAEGFLNGLIHELREDCSIGKHQGEDGVMSYATNKHYVEILMKYIHNMRIDEMVVPSNGASQDQAALVQEWLDKYGD